MSKTYLQEGEIVPVVLAADAVVGDIVVSGNIRGVAMSSGSSGDTINVHVCGVHLLTKKTGTAWVQGDALYWDGSNLEVTKTAADGDYIGDAFAAATSGATTGEVLLRAPGTDLIGSGDLVTKMNVLASGRVTLSSGTTSAINVTSMTTSAKIILQRVNGGAGTALGQLIYVPGTGSFTISAKDPASPLSTETGDLSLVDYYVTSL